MTRRGEHARNSDLAWLAELLAGPALLVPNDGAPPVPSSPAERLIAEETEAGRRRLHAALDSLAHTMRTRTDANIDESLLRVRTSSRRYRLEPLPAPEQVLLAGVIRIHRSRATLAPEPIARRFGLTGRELEVAMLIAAGLSNKSIAAELRLSPHTVKRHSESVFRKVGVTSRAALSARLHR